MDSNVNLNKDSNQNAPTLADQAHAVVDTIKEQGQEKVGQVAEQLRSNVQSGISQQKSRAAESIQAVSETLHDVCHKLNESGNAQLGGYVHRSHEALDRLSDYLENTDLPEILSDAEYYARQRPTFVIGSLFVVGFLAGRFFRSSAPASSSRALAVYEGPAHGYAGVAYRSPDAAQRR